MLILSPGRLTGRGFHFAHFFFFFSLGSDGKHHAWSKCSCLNALMQLLVDQRPLQRVLIFLQFLGWQCLYLIVCMEVKQEDPLASLVDFVSEPEAYFWSWWLAQIKMSGNSEVWIQERKAVLSVVLVSIKPKLWIMWRTHELHLKYRELSVFSKLAKPVSLLNLVLSVSHFYSYLMTCWGLTHSVFYDVLVFLLVRSLWWWNDRK